MHEIYSKKQIVLHLLTCCPICYLYNSFKCSYYSVITHRSPYYSQLLLTEALLLTVITHRSLHYSQLLLTEAFITHIYYSQKPLLLTVITHRSLYYSQVLLTVITHRSLYYSQLLLTEAFSLQSYGEDKYLDAALGCGDVIWERGLLKKGYGLCHGVAGNAYAFLALYRVTGDAKHLARAQKVGIFNVAFCLG